ncbi:hypothetical protein [Candidatus Leptofilum sp.]|uniref:hypothetical protein n=1 Tax=Candidatus Leptofilum sp. TaxID=3241576 RepID=UPI003B5BF097
MNSTQIRKPQVYIFGGLAGILIGAALLFVLEYFLTAPDQANLIYRQMILAFPVYVLLLVSFWAILRGLSLAYHLRRYVDEERP